MSAMVNTKNNRTPRLLMFLLSYSVAITIALAFVVIKDLGRVTVASPQPIPESQWRYHILYPDQIADVCSAFVDQKNHPGLPTACAFKNLITNQCHIFLAPGQAGALFALDYEKKRCAGADI